MSYRVRATGRECRIDQLCNHRVIVAGASGSGKTTVAKAIAEANGIKYVEIDSLFHGPGWCKKDDFLRKVEEFSNDSTWVIEWQYDEVRELLSERSSAVIWLDLPKLVVFYQVTMRTLRRRIFKQELWNGNYEPSLYTFFTDKEHVIRWSWNTWKSSRDKIEKVIHKNPDLYVIHLRSRRQIKHFIRNLD